MKYIYTI